MGEIGYDEEQFLNHLSFWKISAIIRGYRKRNRDMMIMQRWHAWIIINAISEKPIDSPEKILPLPFDKKTKTKEELEKEDIELQHLIEECKKHNARNKEG